MRFFRQVKLLLWKNALVQRRKVCVTVFEFLFPILFALIFMGIRMLVKPERFDRPRYYEADGVLSTFYLGRLEIGYTPDYPSLSPVMRKVVDEIASLAQIPADLKAFKTEASMVDYYKSHSDTMKLSVVFSGLAPTGSLGSNVRFTIRPATDREGEWQTADVFPFYQQGPRFGFDPDYVGTGVLPFQGLIGRTLVEEWIGRNLSSELNLQYQRMPYPPYIDDSMVQVIQTVTPAFIMLSFILPVVQIAKGVVYEKERKLKESMKLMGLLPSAHWASWFLTSMIYLTIVMAIYSVFLGASFSDNGPAIGNGDASLFFVFLLVYGLSIVTFCFMVSVFIQRANVAAVVAGLAHFIVYIPYIVWQHDYQILTYSQKMAMGLLYNCALGLGLNVMGLYLGTGRGLQWSKIAEPATVDDNFSLLDALIMLLVDSTIHLLVTWYIDNVRPGEFGVPKPFYFPFTKTYWCGSSNGHQFKAVSTETSDRHFEREPSGMTPGIVISKLRKEFAKNKPPAVRDMSLTMYEGQVTVLLGHNGAGKTTTMFMLTGFLPPTSGTATVNGHDIRTDIDSVRQSLGLCPQHNILFDTLTVEEHLAFFAELKGCPSSQIRGQVDAMIQEVGLENKRRAKAGTLSGGQKRKLSVGIALINDSKVVILDEPTSGMDPAARRQTWEVLQRHRAGRTLLLTTHFMDEADVLGDRIAIMAEGVVKCCGTSMFLKKLYGTGYHLVLVKKPGCRVDDVTRLIKVHVTTAELESEINAELSYLLPDDQSALFPNLFRDLEEKKGTLGISGFGANATTMEEVFLKVGESASSDDSEGQGEDLTVNGQENPAFARGSRTDMDRESRAVDDEEASILGGAKPSYSSVDILAYNTGYRRLQGVSLQLSRLRAMLIKKMLLSWRSRVLTFVQILVPVVATVIALSIDFDVLGKPDQPLAFDLRPFKGTRVPYSNGTSPDNATERAANLYASQFHASDVTERVDLSKWNNMSAYLLSRAAQLDTAQYNKHVIVGAQFDENDPGKLNARAYYNGQPYHALPISVSLMLNGLAKYYAGVDHSISSGLNPMPKDQDREAEETQTLGMLAGYTVGQFLGFGMAILTGSFVYHLVRERKVGSKHVQVVSGVGPGVFWGANLLWDYLNYLVPSLLILIVFAAFKPAPYAADGRLGIVLLVLVLYGWGQVTFMHLFSFLFTSPPTALVVAIIINIFGAAVTTITVYMLALFTGTAADVGDALNWVFLIISPNHCLGTVFMDMSSNYQALKQCANYTATCLVFPNPCCKNFGNGCGGFICYDFTTNYLSFDKPGVGRAVVFMLLQGAIFLTLTLLIEYHVPQRLTYFLRDRLTGHRRAGTDQFAILSDAYEENEDSDVLEERRRINASPISQLVQTDSLLLCNLYKKYGGSAVVDHLCVGVPGQECFGLLGQNGAGKTTTFKMLTGEIMMDEGNAYLKGFDARNNIKQVQANMGYCPQFDALLDQMTGRETLAMYARLRGVPQHSVRDVVNSLIDTMMLRPHADKLTSQYSGGTKRKLSTGMALVGDPPFILLDEPSTGMDPATRRQLWNVLSRVRASGRTLVLTSHSMEECDALCTRLAIMVNGSFRCLGSSQHLKNKFGQGYTLVASMADTGEGAHQEAFINFVRETFPSVFVFDAHQGYVHLQIPDPRVRLADLFTCLERAKRELHVRDYSVHQTTLEQVFLAFTRHQTPPKEEAKGCWTMCTKGCCCCG